MKITIKGIDVTPERVAGVLANLEDEYNLKIKDMTIYLHFKDENGRVITPKVPLDAKPLFPGKTYQEKIYGSKPLSRELSLEKAVMKVEHKFQRPLTRLEGPLVQDWVENWHITGEELQAILDEVSADSCVQAIDRMLLLKWQRQ